MYDYFSQMQARTEKKEGDLPVTDFRVTFSNLYTFRITQPFRLNQER